MFQSNVQVCMKAGETTKYLGRIVLMIVNALIPLLSRIKYKPSVEVKLHDHYMFISGCFFLKIQTQYCH